MTLGSEVDEGVVKYDCEHVTSPLAGGADLDELIAARDLLRSTGLLGVDETGVSYGNVSARRGAGTAFLISGTQTGWLGQTKAEHYALVTDCSIENNRVTSRGLTAASSEALTHFAVYQACPGLGAVVHVHSALLWNRHVGRLPTTQPQVAYGTPAMAAEIARLARDAGLCEGGLLVMGGHQDGLIAVGGQLSVAVARMLKLWRALAT